MGESAKRESAVKLELGAAVSHRQGERTLEQPAWGILVQSDSAVSQRATDPVPFWSRAQMLAADGELVSRVIERIASPACAQVCFRKWCCWSSARSFNGELLATRRRRDRAQVTSSPRCLHSPIQSACVDCSNR